MRRGERTRGTRLMADRLAFLRPDDEGEGEEGRGREQCAFVRERDGDQGLIAVLDERPKAHLVVQTDHAPVVVADHAQVSVSAKDFGDEARPRVERVGRGARGLRGEGDLELHSVPLLPRPFPAIRRLFQRLDGIQRRHAVLQVVICGRLEVPMAKPQELPGAAIVDAAEYLRQCSDETLLVGVLSEDQILGRIHPVRAPLFAERVNLRAENRATRSSPCTK